VLLNSYFFSSKTGTQARIAFHALLSRPPLKMVFPLNLLGVSGILSLEYLVYAFGKISHHASILREYFHFSGYSQGISGYIINRIKILCCLRNPHPAVSSD